MPLSWVPPPELESAAASVPLPPAPVSPVAPLSLLAPAASLELASDAPLLLPPRPLSSSPMPPPLPLPPPPPLLEPLLEPLAEPLPPLLPVPRDGTPAPGESGIVDDVPLQSTVATMASARKLT
jgi:hypothetical protein